MGLGSHFVDQHIAHWERRLTGGMYPYRVMWPRYLFHHSPIENVVDILKRGVLLSRNDMQGLAARDVAGAGVIEARDHAHPFVRFYFRPRTPTQYHIEGIRRQGECRYGEHAHAPVLVMLMFKARNVLTSEGVSFCDRNMQLGAAVRGESEQYFSEIPFDKVFSEGSTGGDVSYTHHRCAEVLATSPLELNENLKWICCRSDAERTTLLHLLGPAAAKWRSQIHVSDDLIVFQKEYAFVDEVELSSNGVLFRFNPRRDRAALSVAIGVWHDGGELVQSFKYDSLAAYPPDSRRWLSRVTLPDGSYKVKIELDGHRAYEAVHLVGDDLF